MRVIAINGSPKPKGNTYHAIRMVFEELEKEGIETEVVQIGNKPIRSCIACNKCKTDLGKCALGDEDGLNEIIKKVKDADGIILASPVHFAGITGAMKCFCDRLFYVASATDDILFHKVGACVVAVRRSGGSAAWEILQKYLQYPEMMIASSDYWPIIHGLEPGEVEQDEEGVHIMHTLGKNIAWLLKMRKQGLDISPVMTEKPRTNFIR